MEPPSPSLQDLMDVDPPSSTIPCSFSDESRIDVMAPSTPIPKSEIYASLLSTSRMAPSTSNKMQLSVLRTPSTPIPTKFERIHDASTPEERRDFLNWARSVAQAKAESEDLDECDKMLGWASYTAESAASAPEEHDGTGFVTQEHKWRFLKWAHSTSTIQRKSWSLQEEISKPFETALKLFQEELNQNELAMEYGCSHLKQDHMIYTCDKEKHGVYQCQNALWIWPKLRNNLAIYVYQSDGGLKRVGKKIKEKFPESVMIKGRPTVNRFGFVTIKLLGKWIAKSIHKMLKDGIDTWAPKLPVERVIVDYPSVCEETDLDSFQRRAIGYTLMRIIEYCKVDVIIGHSRIKHIKGICLLKIIVAAKRKWIPSDRHKPPRTSYAGYRICTNEPEDNLIKKAKARWVVVEQGISGESAKLLGYTAETVSDCVFTFTILKNHRLAVWGNTFLYLLITRAKIRKITDEFRKDINELKKASEFILEELIQEKAEGWQKGEERILGFHLLKFTEALEESCLSVVPHILCEYLYDLSKKFNTYYSFVLKVGSVRRQARYCSVRQLQLHPHLKGQLCSDRHWDLPLDMGSSVFARCPPENSRLELFSFRAAAIKQFNRVSRGEVFGLISVSDKYRLLSDGGSHFFEPDFAHVPLFDHDWCNPVKTIDWGLVYLGNPSSSHSVPFTSSIEFRMELYVTKKKDACYQLCNHKIELDLSNFWKKSDSACGVLTVEGEDGPTYMFYVLLKEAVDVALEVKFETTCDRKVQGYVVAYYGDDFFYECDYPCRDKDSYMVLLFLPNTSSVLTNCNIPLIRSMLAVPTKGSLIIKAYLEDESGKVIMKNSCKFKSQLDGCSIRTVSGTDCSFKTAN
nr:arginine--tRNA ligase, chloroplastic/mitochondrial [Tanacetum cinerariifolium]